MDLIPAIDLMNGKCVRLFKGDFDKRKDFTKEPHEQAKFWESEGAKYIPVSYTHLTLPTKVSV